MIVQRLRGILIGLLATAAACSKAPVVESDSATAPIHVTIGAAPRIGIGIESRTQVDAEGLEVQWSGDDRIALWARAADGTMALDKAEFALWHYATTWQEALFRGDIPAMDEAQTYTYYAAYPVPASTADEAQQLTYEIPAVQDGAFHGDWDVMVATPIEQAAALVAGDNSGSVSLDFHHQVHLLRIRIPENKLGEPVTQLKLTFPTAVTGTLTVNLADPQTQPQISGSQSVTLQFAEPKNAGDVVFATIAPVTLQATDQIEIVATGSIYESQTRTFAGKDFQAGHTTPISYTVPEAGKILGTMLRFTLNDTGVNTLGEAIQRLWVAADGVTFETGSAEAPFTVNEKGQYEMLLPEGSGIPDQLNAAGALTVYYDSEHATVTRQLTLPTINTQAVNEITLPDVPYLFEEDFNGVQGFEINSENTTSVTSSGSNSARDLSKYGLAGWTGARCGAAAGKSLRLCSRNECGVFVYGSYHGRVDTPTLSGIKAGKYPTLRISFNYAFARQSNTGYTKNPHLAMGVTSDANHNTVGASSPDGSIMSYNVPNAVIWDITGSLDGNYDNVYLQQDNIVVSNCSQDQRIVWEAYMKDKENSGFNNMSNNWVYLDNIRVSIVNQ